MNQQNYLVLARKWRPQKFDDVVGQKHITDILKNALAQGRIGQGYLFIGTRGVGKTTIARILSKALNCLNYDSVNNEPCCECDNCTSIRDGNSLDVVEIDGASNRSIEDIRRIRDTVSITPVSSKFKVYIIDEVHMLTKEAFNALLKTLEEPPAHVKFFFATTEPHKIPATIVSRVQKFELRLMTRQILHDYLKKIAKLENVAVEEGAIAAITRAGNGSVRDALSVFDQVLALASDHIDAKEVTALLGWTDNEIFYDINKALIEQNLKLALASVKRVIEKGRDPEQFVIGLMEFLRNMLIFKSTENPEASIEEMPEYINVLSQSCENYSIDQLIYSIDTLLELTPRLAATEAKQTALEIAILKLLRARKKVSLDDIFARLAALESGSVVNLLEKKLDAQPATQAIAPVPQPAANTETAETNENAAENVAAMHEPLAEYNSPEAAKLSLQEAWQKLCSELESNDPKNYHILQNVSPSFADTNLIDMTLDSKESMEYTVLSDKNLNQKFKVRLNQLTGKDIEFKFTFTEKEKVAVETQEITLEQKVESAKKLPIVQAAFELFPDIEITNVEN